MMYSTWPDRIATITKSCR